MPALLSGQLKLAGLTQQITTFEHQIQLAERLIYTANEVMAQEVAQSMVDVLNEKVQGRGRVQRPDQLLQETLLSPENRHVSASRFTVGDPEYLNSIEYVKAYWKSLEAGGHKLAGRMVIAFFGRGSGGHGSGATEPFSSPSDFRGDARMPQVSQAHYEELLAHGKIGHIRRFAMGDSGWPAYHYLRDGGKNWLGKQSAGRTYAQQLKSIGLYRSR
jgi:hypothetical protein